MNQKQNSITNDTSYLLDYCPLCHKTNRLPGLIEIDTTTTTTSPSPLIICAKCFNIKFNKNNTNLDENKLLNLAPQFPYPDKLDQYYTDINNNPVPEWIANDKQIEKWNLDLCKWDDKFNSDNYYYSNK